MKKLKILFCSLIVLSLSACTKQVVRQKGQVLKIGVMPAVDSAPILLAEELGLFEAAGLEIEIQIYNNAMNRQSALQSGELDGAMTDVIALVNNVGNGFDIKITTSTDGLFPLLINADLNPNKALKFGMMEVSVTNYLSDTLLKKFSFEKEYVTELPARLAMVGNGTLDGAIIPEPMASQGALGGLKKVVLDFEDEFSPEVMVFTSDSIKEKKNELKLFHRVYNQAVDLMIEEEDLAREVLIKKLDLNPQIKDDILFPKYNHARIPSESYLKSIIKWNETVLGQKFDLDPKSLVDESFIK